jgi:hypothetical protein
MRAALFSWPRLIGIASGVFGAAATAGFAAGSALGSPILGPPTAHNLAQLIASVCALLFLVIAYPLYTGRDWARRALLVITISIAIALAVFVSVKAVQESRVAVHGVASAEMARKLPFEMLMRGVVGGSVALCILTPPLFLTFVLLQQDVRRSFRRSTAHDDHEDT